ncbi:hypothetical protein GCM10023093_24560 [Nemorincola caseinilytica]|uniref:Uncharacterized protein n=1 Tax=Nemorincola caseinilytica TaxID=2054315 RepID=A0ABP8NJ49_9BACT
MNNNLSDIEQRLLEKFLRDSTLNEAKSLQIALRNFLAEEKDALMQELSLDERDIRALQTQASKNILDFLKSNDFIAEREGGVLFITDRGKQLRKQGTLAKYEEWQKDTRAKNKVIIQTIETRGYLDQDQIIRNRRALIIKRIKKFVLYPLLLIILFFFLLLGAHHYNLDKNVPAVRNFFNKVKNNADSTANEEAATDGEKQKDTHSKKKKGHKGH